MREGEPQVAAEAGAEPEGGRNDGDCQEAARGFVFRVVGNAP